MRECLVMCLNLVTFAPMNEKEKLIRRFRAQPINFTLERAEALLAGLGFMSQLKHCDQ